MLAQSHPHTAKAGVSLTCLEFAGGRCTRPQGCEIHRGRHAPRSSFPCNRHASRWAKSLCSLAPRPLRAGSSKLNRRWDSKHFIGPAVCPGPDPPTCAALPDCAPPRRSGSGHISTWLLPGSLGRRLGEEDNPGFECTPAFSLGEIVRGRPDNPSWWRTCYHPCATNLEPRSLLKCMLTAASYFCV